MKKALILVLALGLAMPFLGGCGQGEDQSAVEKESQATPALCGNCGQLKGSDSCCQDGAETCSGCQLAKGSPGCCKITKGEDVALCSGCGQIKGSDVCCADTAEKCDKCDLAKGSPGCCKIAKK